MRRNIQLTLGYTDSNNGFGKLDPKNRVCIRRLEGRRRGGGIENTQGTGRVAPEAEERLGSETKDRETKMEGKSESERWVACEVGEEGAVEVEPQCPRVRGKGGDWRRGGEEEWDEGGSGSGFGRELREVEDAVGGEWEQGQRTGAMGAGRKQERRDKVRAAKKLKNGEERRRSFSLYGWKTE